MILTVERQGWHIADAIDAAEQNPEHVTLLDPAEIAAIEGGAFVYFWILGDNPGQRYWFRIPAVVVARVYGELLRVLVVKGVPELGIDDDAEFVIEPGHVAGILAPWWRDAEQTRGEARC